MSIAGSIPLTEYFPFRAAFLFVFGNPKVVLPMNAIQCNSSGMNATILMRIMPDLGSKYAIRVDGETVGNLETLDEALLALERLRDRDFTVEQARKMLDVFVVRGKAHYAIKKAVSAGKAERCNV